MNGDQNNRGCKYRQREPQASPSERAHISIAISIENRRGNKNDRDSRTMRKRERGDTRDVGSEASKQGTEKKAFVVKHVEMIRCTSCICMIGGSRFWWFVWVTEN